MTETSPDLASPLIVLKMIPCLALKRDSHPSLQEKSLWPSSFAKETALLRRIGPEMEIFLALACSNHSNVASSTSSMDRCPFCAIIAGKKQQDDIVFQDGEVTVFKDHRPASTFHLLACPVEHIQSARCLRKCHLQLLDKLVERGLEALKELGGDVDGVRLGFHSPPLVSHLHLHVISPTSAMSWFSRTILFRPDSYWFLSPEWVRQRLEAMADE